VRVLKVSSFGSRTAVPNTSSITVSFKKKQPSPLAKISWGVSLCLIVLFTTDVRGTERNKRAKRPGTNWIGAMISYNNFMSKLERLNPWGRKGDNKGSNKTDNDSAVAQTISGLLQEGWERSLGMGCEAIRLCQISRDIRMAGRKKRDFWYLQGGDKD